MRARWCLLLVLVACNAPARPVTAPSRTAQPASAAGFEYLTFVTGASRDGARAEDRLPMIIGLHYSSARPEAIVADFDQLAISARVVLPRGKHPRRTGYSWFPGDYAQRRADEQRTLTFAAKDELVAFIDAVTRAHPTAGAPIVTGVSYGGDLSYLLAIHEPARVAAAFPVGARFPPDWMPAASTCGASCPAVHVLHGTDDAVVPIAGARDAAARLAALGFPVELHAYPGVGHAFTPQMKADFTAAVTRLLGPSRSAGSAAGP